MKHGSGSGRPAIEYLLADKDHENQLRESPPELLRGDPEVTASLIDSLSFAQRYTSGVLSFTEDEVFTLAQSPEMRFELIDSFEREFLAPGMDINRLSTVWIQHRDHDRTELHFIIANVDLETEKRFPAYYDRADRARLASWQDVQNLSRGMDDPRDPARRRAVDHAERMPKEKSELAAALEKAVKAKCVNGELKSRTEIVDYIQASGLKVGRQGKDYITVHCGEGKNDRFRLKGELFSEHYRFDRTLQTRGSRDERESKADTERRLGEAHERLQSTMQRRREYLEERFGVVTQVAPERHLGEHFRDESAARGGQQGREGVDAEAHKVDQTRSPVPDSGDRFGVRGGDWRHVSVVEESESGVRPHAPIVHRLGQDNDRGRAGLGILQPRTGQGSDDRKTNYELAAVPEGGLNERNTERSGGPVARIVAAVESGLRGAREAFERSVHALHARARTAIQGFRGAVSNLDRALQRNDRSLPELDRTLQRVDSFLVQHRQTAHGFDDAYAKTLTRILQREVPTRAADRQPQKGRGHSWGR